MHFINQKYFRWVILIILLIGWSFMTWQIGRDSLWQNEIVSFFRATQPKLADTYTEIANDDSAPLHEIIILRPWLKLGHQEFWLRIPSAFFSFLAVAVVFRFCVDFLNRKIALATTLIYLLNPIQLYYAREGRMYALLALMTVAWVYFLYRAIRTEGKEIRPFVWYAVFAAGSVYAHYYGGIALLSASIATIAYIIWGRNFVFAWRWFLANCGAALLFLPWIATFLYQLNNDPISSLTDPSLGTFGKIFGRFFVGFYWLPSWFEWIASLGVLALIAVGFLLLIWQKRDKEADLNLFLYLSTISITSILMAFLLSKIITPMFVVRYFSGVIPLLIILVVLAIMQLRIPFLVNGSIAAIILGSLFFAQHTVTTVWRKDYRSAVEMMSQLESGQNENDVLFFSPGGGFWLDEFEHYYTLEHPVTFMTNQSVAETDLDSLLIDIEANGVWIVQADQSHLVNEVNLDGEKYHLTYDQSFFSNFFLHSRTLRISYLEPAN